MTVCHEHKGPKGPAVRNCSTDEGRPLGTGLQEQVPNHLWRLWTKSHGRERRWKRPGKNQVR